MLARDKRRARVHTQVGRDEVSLDDSLKPYEKAKAAGGNSTMEIWDGMIRIWHAFQLMLPEARQAITRVGAFLQAQ